MALLRRPEHCNCSCDRSLVWKPCSRGFNRCCLARELGRMARWLGLGLGMARLELGLGLGLLWLGLGLGLGGRLRLGLGFRLGCLGSFLGMAPVLVQPVARRRCSSNLRPGPLSILDPPTDRAGYYQVFDSFECAILAIAPWPVADNHRTAW